MLKEIDNMTQKLGSVNEEYLEDLHLKQKVTLSSHSLELLPKTHQKQHFRKHHCGPAHPFCRSIL